MIRHLWFGLAGGLLAGTGVGLAEAVWVLSQVPTGEYVAFMVAAALYSLVGAVLGLAIGVGLTVVGLAWPRLPGALSLSLSAVVVGACMGGYVLVDQLDRAVFLELGLGMVGRLEVGAVLGAFALVGLWLGPIFLTRTPFKILLQPRGTLAAWLTCIGLAVLFALAPGDDPTLVALDARSPPPTDLGNTPDVVLVTVEDWRSDATPGGALALDLPALTRLEHAAITFDQHVASSSWRRPTLATIMTGELPEAHGVDTVGARLGADRLTLAEVLSDRGYVTGSAPARAELERALGFDQGFDWTIESAAPRALRRLESIRHLALATSMRNEWRHLRRVPPERADLHRPADEVVAQAERFIAQSRKGGFRYLAWLHLAEPSIPYFSNDGREVAEARPPGELDAAGRDRVRRLYSEEVRAMDAALGQLIDWLRAQGAWEDTLLVVTGTNGVELFDHGSWGDGDSLYDEEIRTPLYIKLPGQRWAGRHVPWQVSQLDVGPTIVAAAGIECPDSWEGEPLLGSAASAWLDGDATAGPPVREPAVAQLHRHGAIVQAIRAPPLKLIRSNAGNPRDLPVVALFDLDEDPWEQDNLAGRRDPEQVTLTRALRGIVTRAGSWRTAATVSGPEPAAPPSAQR